MAKEAKYKVIITDSEGNEFGSNFIGIPYSSTESSGTIKIASDTDITEGTDNTKAVTPNQLNSKLDEDVVTNISYSYNSSSNKSYIIQKILNLASEEEFSSNIEIPLATSTQPGLISTSQLNTLTNALQVSDITTGTENGTIAVKGTNVSIYGLTETAYTDKDYFAVDSEVLHNSGDQALDGSLTISGNVIISGNLSVTGTTTTTDAETLAVQDNLIITNSTGATLTNNSGLAIRTGTNEEAYAIIYDPTSTIGGSVKLGLGTINDDNEFTFGTDEGSPVATRADSTDLTNGDLLEWDGTNYKLVDSGLKVSDINNYIDTLTSNLNVEISNREAADVALQSNINEKQGALSTTQLAAVNSGITATKVSTYDSYSATISSNTSSIEAEISRAKSVESTLQASIANEASSRETADTTLQTNIDAKQDILTAGTSIIISSNTISVNIDDDTSTTSTNPVQNKVITSALNSEIASRQAADAELEDDITELQEAIDTTVVKYVTQTLTEDQQLQARENIDASSIESVELSSWSEASLNGTTLTVEWAYNTTLADSTLKIE